jgi:enoyl-CoA hydratase
MGPDDAILAGFADSYIPRQKWTDLIDMLEASGDATHVTTHAEAPPQGEMRLLAPQINQHFSGETLADIGNSLRADDSDFARKTLKSISRNSPLSMACATEIIHRLRQPDTSIRSALELEYRFTFRAMQYGDFLEGIRAQIIDKDRTPAWRHKDFNVPAAEIANMLSPLGDDTLIFDT